MLHRLIEYLLAVLPRLGRRGLPAGLVAMVVVTTASGSEENSGWRHASVAGFEIYSDVAESGTEKLLHEIALVNYDFQLVWPMRKNPTFGTVIFCDRPALFDRLNPPLPADRTNPSGGRPATTRESMHMVNFRYRAPSIFIPTGYPPAVEYTGGNRLQEHYSNCFLNLVGERVPPWLSQGLGKLIQGMCCAEGTIEFPALTTDPTLLIRVRTNGSEQSLQEALRNGTFLTLEQLFATTNPPQAKHAHVVKGRNGDFVIGPGQRDFWVTLPFGVFVDEAYEFAHFCLFAEKGKYRDAFIKFAQAASNGPADEAGFRNFFGMDEHTMLSALWRYTAISADQVIQVAPAGTGKLLVPAMVFRPASETEIDAMLAKWKSLPVGQAEGQF